MNGTAVLKIRIVDAAGSARVIDARADQSVMDAAVNNDVAGIDAECGGEMACGTCHVYVDDGWLNQLCEQSDVEREAIDFLVIDEVRPESRLSCQIRLSVALDGLSVAVPAQ